MNSRTIEAAAALALIQALLVGCATPPPAIGMFEDTAEVLYGEASPEYDSNSRRFVKAGDFKLRGSDTGLVCVGRIAISLSPLYEEQVTEDMTCRKQGGKVSAQCGSDRLLEATWKADSCVSGSGLGRDSSGTAFAFTFGIQEHRALDWIERNLGTHRDRPAWPRTNHVK